MRSLRLSAQGVAALEALLAGTSHPGVTALERRLVEASMLLRSPGTSRGDDVAVVIPAHASASEVTRTLDGVPAGVAVVVVDDASPEPLASALATRDGLVVQRTANRGGAAAARNAGAATTSSELLAFVDSDVALTPGWLDRLSGHLVHPEVVAVAPRIRSRPAKGLVDILERHLCALDLGPISCDVRRGARVSYVPSTVLIVRRSAFEAVGGFDEALRIGEDVDLVWRLQDIGTVRYDDDEVAHHGPRTSLRTALRRRWDYGTSAAPLDLRHPDRLRHLVLSVWSALPWATAVLHPALGVATAGALVGFAPRGMPSLAEGQARKLAALGQLSGFRSVARYAVRPLWPATLTASLTSRRVRRLLPWLTVGYLAAIARDLRGSSVPGIPARLALRLADDLVYSGGVWQSCVRDRRPGPLLPGLVK
jgi:mycofactocin system glycosyltransferase